MKRPQKPRGPLLGAHLSAAGTFTKALDRAAELRAEALQIFTRAPGMWRARDFREGEAEAFRQRRAEIGGIPAIAHDIYLTNLAAPPGDLRDKSIATLVDERKRCAELGLDGLVCHMGAHLGDGVDVGLERYAAGLREVLARTPGLHTRILLENAAGQGSCLGSEIEHLGRVLAMVDVPDELGVCIDTCHAFASGYDLTTPEGYERLWDELERHVGLASLRAFHLNDSKKGLSCHVDRHEHIGRGFLGKETFARLLHDPRVAGIPMVIETPEMEDGMDRVNLALLRKLRKTSLR